MKLHNAVARSNNKSHGRAEVSLPRIFADLQNADSKGRVRLIFERTFQDMKRLAIEVRPNIRLSIYDEEVEAVALPRVFR